MSKQINPSTPSIQEVNRLRTAVHLLIRALLVSGTRGAPAEGRIPFNPLYFHILGLLKEHGSTRPSALAVTLQVPRSTLSTASKALQTRKLILESPDPEDGRAKVLSLTKDGLDVANAIERQDQKNMKLMLELVDAERRAIVVDVLEEISQLLAVK